MHTRQFFCENPDFWVQSLPDHVKFGVRRSALETSDTFRDMFSYCDQGFMLVARGSTDALELDEPTESLQTLLYLLHSPPAPPSLSLTAHERRRRGSPVSKYGGSIIPYPLLPEMLRLADKYVLSDPLTRSLHSHLLANASISPLKVYSFALANRFQDVVAEASAYLLHPPLSSYSREEIASIPSAAAYHDLVRLHAFRIKHLKRIVLNEDVFPFGYGVCPTHQKSTTRMWNGRRMYLATQVEAATDLAAEMSVLLQQVASCQTCYRACKAAIEMLEYKCQRIARTIDCL
ncbi:hypothetical protein F5I97DRAFT_1596380 [Phlebopus sp. FC_14]|nr:hypothetical protein F5I97DRAFT_1596380 [Phlebopus sp. FC_14]